MSTPNSDFLLTEITLNLLGNKFYDVDGNCVNDLQALYELNHDENNFLNDEPNLAVVIGNSENILNSQPNNGIEETIVLEDEQDATTTEAAAIATTEEIHQESKSLCVTTKNKSIDIDVTNSTSSCAAIENKEASINSNIFSSSSEEKSVITSDKEVPSTSSTKASNSKSTLNNQNIRRKSVCQNVPVKTKRMRERLYLDMLDQSNSDDIKQRVEVICRIAQYEYKSMMNDSMALKKNFLELNQELINVRSLKPDEFLLKFYAQQESSLVEESDALMQFIRIVKHEVEDDLFEEIVNDVTEARDTFIN